MKLTRRKFFAGLAVAPLVAVAKAAPVLADNMSLALARWTKDGPLSNLVLSNKMTSISTMHSAETWRKLYTGAEPSLSSDWWETEEGKEVMNETNEILNEMKWKNYDGD